MVVSKYVPELIDLLHVLVVEELHEVENVFELLASIGRWVSERPSCIVANLVVEVQKGPEITLQKLKLVSDCTIQSF